MRHIVAICDGCGIVEEETNTEDWIRFTDYEAVSWDNDRQFCSTKCVHIGTGMDGKDRMNFRYKVSTYLDGLKNHLILEELAE